MIMVRAKHPTRDQKMLIAKARLNPADWLVRREAKDKLYLVNKSFDAGKVIEK